MPASEPDGRVGVVMITRDRRDEALANVERLRDLPERPEIVVVDNGSSDGTAEALRRDGGVRVIALPFNAGAAGRSAGAALLRAPYVAFADDDSWWEPGSLRRAGDLLDRHGDVAVINAAIMTGQPERLDLICEEMADSPLGDGQGPGTELVSFMAGSSVLRRRAYFEHGGFEPRLLIGGEEELLAMDLLAAAWRIVYVPDVIVHHHASGLRDPHGRRRIGIRNTLWTTWLRRSPQRALRRTLDLAKVAQRDAVTAQGFADALRGLPWVLAERRALPAHAERKLRAVERSQLASKARRYVS